MSLHMRISLQIEKCKKKTHGAEVCLEKERQKEFHIRLITAVNVENQVVV